MLMMIMMFRSFPSHSFQGVKISNFIYQTTFLVLGKSLLNIIFRGTYILIHLNECFMCVSVITLHLTAWTICQFKTILDWKKMIIHLLMTGCYFNPWPDKVYSHRTQSCWFLICSATQSWSVCLLFSTFKLILRCLLNAKKSKLIISVMDNGFYINNFTFFQEYFM